MLTPGLEQRNGAGSNENWISKLKAVDWKIETAYFDLFRTTRRPRQREQFVPEPDRGEDSCGPRCDLGANKINISALRVGADQFHTKFIAHIQTLRMHQ